LQALALLFQIGFVHPNFKCGIILSPDGWQDPAHWVRDNKREQFYDGRNLTGLVFELGNW